MFLNNKTIPIGQHTSKKSFCNTENKHKQQNVVILTFCVVVFLKMEKNFVKRYRTLAPLFSCSLTFCLQNKVICHYGSLKLPIGLCTQHCATVQFHFIVLLLFSFMQF